MIQQIIIYPADDVHWSMQIGKDSGQVLVDEVPASALADLLAYARSIKTHEEETLERVFVVAEQSASDEQMLDLADIAPQWEIGIDYDEGQVRKFGDNLYRCLQNHDSQVNREPDKAVSLWVEIGADEASGEEIIEWYEPTSERYYTLGQLVRYKDGKVYESLLAVNTWSPEQYAAGWKLREDLE